MEAIVINLRENHAVSNSFGHEICLSAELIAWNNICLVLLTIASLMVLVNRLTHCNKKNAITKIMFGGLSLTSLIGLLYPMQFGLIGVNIVVTLILLYDFFTHNKNTCNGNRE